MATFAAGVAGAVEEGAAGGALCAGVGGGLQDAASTTPLQRSFFIAADASVGAESRDASPLARGSRPCIPRGQRYASGTVGQWDDETRPKDVWLGAQEAATHEHS